MHRLTRPPRPTRLELQARGMYRRMLSQWAGDYLLCRRLMAASHRGRGGGRPGDPPSADWFAPAMPHLMED